MGEGIKRKTEKEIEREMEIEKWFERNILKEKEVERKRWREREMLILGPKGVGVYEIQGR